MATVKVDMSDWEPVAQPSTAVTKVDMSEWEPMTPQKPATMSSRFGPLPKIDVPELFHPALQFAKEEGAPIAGGIIGSALGTPAGIPGMIAGAGLGGAAGRAWQRNAEYATGSRSPLSDTPLGNAVDIAKSGAAQAVGEATGIGASKLLEKAMPMAAKLGGQLNQAANATPAKYGEAVLKNPEILSEAMTPVERSTTYKAFEKKHDLTGIEESMRKNWQKKTPAQLEELSLSAARRLSDSKTAASVTKQELYEASQAARKIRDLAARGDVESVAVMNGGLVSDAKTLIDDSLEKMIPEYGPLRQKSFESYARESFSHPLPLNKNLSPNALRTTAALGALAAGHPGAIAAVSPFLVGKGIQAAHMVAPAVELGASGAVRAKLQGLADASPAAPEPESPHPAPALSLISAALKANPLNTTGSRELRSLNIPKSMASDSGTKSISDVARILHEAGAINDNDEGEAIKYLKSISGKVK